MVRIYTFYDEDKPIYPEVNTKPSLTDSTFFESLSDMVPRIVRGELPPGVSRRGFFEFENDASDDVFDGDPLTDSPDDLTDMDAFLSTSAERSAQAKPADSDEHGEETSVARQLQPKEPAQPAQLNEASARVSEPSEAKA